MCALWATTSLLRTARADTPIRITGSATIEGSASSGARGVELRARLFDDASHSIPGADLKLRVRGGRPSNAHSCAGRATELMADADGAFTTRTDAAGAICVLFADSLERSQIEIGFTDPSGLYAPTTTLIPTDSARGALEIVFSPAPSTIPLESAQARVALRTRTHPTLEQPVLLGLTLSVSSDKTTKHQLLERPALAGESLELTFATRELPGPGPVTLSAEFAGNETLGSAHATVRVEATARVQLALIESLSGDLRDGVHVRVRASSCRGAVPTGSVEARLRGTSVASAAVVNGAADIWLQLDDTRERSVELRYAPDTTWWISGSPLEVELPVSQATPWQRLPWMLALLTLGAWLVAGWRRPQRAAVLRAVTAREKLEGGVDVVATSEDGRSWSGKVVDRHDQTPIAGAVISATLPAFSGSGAIASTTSDAEGLFELTEWSAPRGAEVTLEVRAPWHTPLVAPLPRPGKLVISLVSRRRTLLTRFVEWAGRAGHARHAGGREPTPGEVGLASRVAPPVSEWARAVDEAAFGPEPLSEGKEQSVVAREPSVSKDGRAN
jgi:hypothetical protein